MSRIVSIDVFRGLLLFSMTFNHLILFPFIGLPGVHGWLQTYVYGTFGYFSNSEGFFFLAGLICGVVYGKSREFLWSRVKKRIVQMYCVHLGLLLGFALFVACSTRYFANWKELHSLIWVWIDQPGIHYFLDHPWNGFCLGSLFLYTPPFFDILPLYMLFLAITPFLLRQFHQGRVWQVCSVSALLWLVPQYVHTDMLEGFLKLYLPVKLGWFHPLALQLLFVSGLAIGFFHVKGTLISMWRLFLLSACFLIAMYVVLHASAVDLSNCHHLGLLRLGMFALKAFAAYLIAKSISLQAFAALGRYSLTVFTYHVVLVYGLVFFLAELSSCSLELQVIFLVVSLLSLWLPVALLEKKGRFFTQFVKI